MWCHTKNEGEGAKAGNGSGKLGSWNPGGEPEDGGRPYSFGDGLTDAKSVPPN